MKIDIRSKLSLLANLGIEAILLSAVGIVSIVSIEHYYALTAQNVETTKNIDDDKSNLYGQVDNIYTSAKDES